MRHGLRILALIVVATACQRDSATPASVDGESVAPSASVSADSTAATTRSDATGTTARSTPGIEGLPVDPDTLVVGDCFNRYAGLQNYQTIEIVTKRSCAQPHDGEIFYKSDYEGSVTVNTYPGKERLTTDSIRVCYENFLGFVGKAYETSSYQLGYFLPQQDRWESTTERYRAVTCYVTAYARGTKLTGTVRDSRL
ncbi:MAG TPA: septum formation family protein [Acidimicrobiales bacterium]|nr:septum formation family protein [Acidimicrobiales bacterium]